MFAFVGKDFFVGNAWGGEQWMHGSIQWASDMCMCLIATVEEEHTIAIVCRKTNVFHINRFLVGYPYNWLVLQIADKQLDQTI